MLSFFITFLFLSVVKGKNAVTFNPRINTDVIKNGTKLTALIGGDIGDLSLITDSSLIANDKRYYLPIISALFPDQFQKILDKGRFIRGVWIDHKPIDESKDGVVDGIHPVSDVWSRFNEYWQYTRNYTQKNHPLLYNKTANMFETSLGFFKHADCIESIYFIGPKGTLLSPYADESSENHTDLVEWYVRVPHPQGNNIKSRAMERVITDEWDEFLTRREAGGCLMGRVSSQWWGNIKVMHYGLGVFTSWDDIVC